jgi:hypothetical protein
MLHLHSRNVLHSDLEFLQFIPSMLFDCCQGAVTTLANVPSSLLCRMPQACMLAVSSVLELVAEPLAAPADVVSALQQGAQRDAVDWQC